MLAQTLILVFLYTYLQFRNIACERVVHHTALFLLSVESGVWHRLSSEQSKKAIVVVVKVNMD